MALDYITGGRPHGGGVGVRTCDINERPEGNEKIRPIRYSASAYIIAAGAPKYLVWVSSFP